MSNNDLGFRAPRLTPSKSYYTHLSQISSLKLNLKTPDFIKSPKISNFPHPYSPQGFEVTEENIKNIHAFVDAELVHEFCLEMYEQNK
jgi:hypothetical protein